MILVNGALAAYLARGDRQLITFLPDAEPDRSKVGRAVARVLIDRARTGGDAPRGMLIEEIDGAPPAPHPLAPLLAEAGFVAGAMGFQATFRRTEAGRAGRAGGAGWAGRRGRGRKGGMALVRIGMASPAMPARNPARPALPARPAAAA